MLYNFFVSEIKLHNQVLTDRLVFEDFLFSQYSFQKLSPQ